MFEVCPTCTDTSAQTAAPLADRGINDRLVELHRRLRACVRARGAHFEHIAIMATFFINFDHKMSEINKSVSNIVCVT